MTLDSASPCDLFPTEPYTKAAHKASVEASFLVDSIIGPYLSREQERIAKSALDRLRQLAADVEEDDDDGILEYSVTFLQTATKVYLSSLI